ncbi:hypothetical protein [Rhodococcoides kroppenstedtii]|uniref:hypothetical protein n=1 Tax=Rhodococcoides kroppenstedtii TaxID=293050 RepID=UPI0028E2DD5C|nr:hypothetical protein [Rhodococcus kroppenstedtii]
MKTPTWEDLEARNAAATRFELSGSLYVAGHVDTGPVDDHFLFWFGRGNRWWVERNGSAVYASASSTGAAPVARINGHMVHQRTDSVIRLGKLFTPSDLFGPRSLLTRRTKSQHSASTPEPTSYQGRQGWSVTLTSSTGPTTVLTIDDRTGLITTLNSVDHEQSLRLDDLVEHHDLPDSRFEWHGSTIERNESPDFKMTW